MNKIKGHIRAIDTQDDLSVVVVGANAAAEISLTAIVIETPAQTKWLQPGHPITCLFKETELVIAKTSDLQISMQNKLPCIITGITSGQLLCDITLQFGHQHLRSIITRNACEQMNLRPGDAVTALIKTTEVSISAHD